MLVPYENATSGENARGEIMKMLRLFGCESVGFMDDFEDKSILLAFKHRGRRVQLKASAKGWAALYIKEHPHTARARCSPRVYEQKILARGQVAINSILRDWVKGQVTAVECGVMSFDAVFMPYMLANDGRPLMERLGALDLLPPPQDQP